MNYFMGLFQRKSSTILFRSILFIQGRKVHNFVMVAGCQDYVGDPDYRIICDRRIRQLSNKYKNEEKKFYVFDFSKFREASSSKPGTEKDLEKPEQLKLDTYISKKEDDGTQTINIKKPTKTLVKKELSILDVYQTILDIGTSEPKTLLEFSIFSHAYWSGPILFNTYDNSSENSVTRDPADRDPRCLKDFLAGVNQTRLPEFSQAFDPNGVIWIWGCNAQIAFHKFLMKIEKHPEYKSTISDSKILNFSGKYAFTADEVSFLENQLGTTFSRQEKITGNIKLAFGVIKSIVAVTLQYTYASYITNHAKTVTYAALPGTSAVIDENTGPVFPKINDEFSLKKGEPNLMHIPESARLFNGHFTFYKKHFGMELEPSGRNYGQYVPKRSP